MELSELNLTEEQLSAVQKYAQSEADKVRTKYSTELKSVKDELDKLKPKEKSDDEKAFEERLKALEDKEKLLAAKERKQTIASKLKEKGIPEELADFVSVGDDIDADVEKVGAALGNYFLNTGYKPESHSNSKGLTKQQFRSMSYMDRAKLFRENPELYKMLAQ